MLAMMMVVLLMRVVLDFKNLNLAELCSYGNQIVIAVYMVNMNV